MYATSTILNKALSLIYRPAINSYKKWTVIKSTIVVVYMCMQMWFLCLAQIKQYGNWFMADEEKQTIHPRAID